MERGQSLSPRETEVARLVAEGLTNKEIGLRCGLTESTVKSYLRSVQTKLGTRNRVEVTNFVRDHLK